MFTLGSIHGWSIALLYIVSHFYCILASGEHAHPHRIQIRRVNSHNGGKYHHALHHSKRQLAPRNVLSNTLVSSSSIIAPIQVGTPPQDLWVLLDTASADLALFNSDYADQYNPKETDDEVKKPTSLFQAEQSSTYRASDSTFRNFYGTGSTATYFSAVKSTDNVAFESLLLKNQPLGLIHEGNVSYGPQAAGILGLAFESASEGLRATPAVQQMYFSGALKEPVFSFALMRPSADADETSQANVSQPGGIFTLGQLDSEQYQGQIGWSELVSTTPDSDYPTKWLAPLDVIKVNGQEVAGTKNTIANFDTGSSASRASESFIDALVSHVDGSYKDGVGNYYIPCSESDSTSMNVTISMGGVSIDVEPLDLLFKTTQYTAKSQSGTYCQLTLSPTTADDYDLQIGDDILRSMFVAFSFSPPRVGIAQPAEAVSNQAAKPVLAAESTSPLKMQALTAVQAPSNTQDLSTITHTQPVASSATVHASSNSAGEIASGGILVTGTSVRMQDIVASTTASHRGSLSSTLSSSPTQNDGVIRNPTTSPSDANLTSDGVCMGPSSLLLPLFLFMSIFLFIS